MSDVNVEEVWKQLGLLRAVTARTGVLHHAQVFQMQMWSRLAVPHAESTSLAWDADGRLIEIRAVVAKKKQPKDFVKRLKGLDRSLKDLLGPDVTVRVKIGKKTIFTGAGKQDDGGRSH